MEASIPQAFNPYRQPMSSGNFQHLLHLITILAIVIILSNIVQLVLGLIQTYMLQTSMFRTLSAKYIVQSCITPLLGSGKPIFWTQATSFSKIPAELSHRLYCRRPLPFPSATNTRLWEDYQLLGNISLSGLHIIASRPSSLAKFRTLSIVPDEIASILLIKTCSLQSWPHPFQVTSNLIYINVNYQQ